MAAAGWAGDLLVVYTRGKESAVIWWTTWDTDADAEEAFRAARTFLTLVASNPDGS